MPTFHFAVCVKVTDAGKGDSFAAALIQDNVCVNGKAATHYRVVSV